MCKKKAVQYLQLDERMVLHQMWEAEKERLSKMSVKERFEDLETRLFITEKLQDGIYEELYHKDKK